jgi:hypothetical protein
MDPFIEARSLWTDFHDSLAVELRRFLNAHLPPRYDALVAERIFIEANEEVAETFLEVHDSACGDRVVTCIEVLSPTNKRPGSPGWAEYERKRQLMFRGAANFIEIDLLRGGRRRAMRQPWPASPYYALVMRQEEAPRCQVFPAYTLQRLPTIPIPLAPPDADVPCDLAAAVDDVLASSRYGRRLAYDQPIEPPLDDAERSFLRSLPTLRGRS